MKLLRRTGLHTVQFVTKGGAVFTHKFHSISWKLDNGRFESLSWVTVDGSFSIVVDDITAISVIDTKAVWKFREKME